MFEKDNEVISYALSMWANYVETGSVSLSRNDAIKRGMSDQVKELDDFQVGFVLRLRKLSKEYLQKED